MVGAWCFGCCQAHPGLPVGFLYSFFVLLFTVESFSMFYLLFISWITCFRRWCIDKLGVFYAKPNIYVSWSTSELLVILAPLNWFKYFHWPFQGGTSFVDQSFVCYAFVPVCLCVPCGHLLGKGWPLGSRLWCLTVSLLLSPFPGSGVVLDCIDSWSLPSFLLK